MRNLTSFMGVAGAIVLLFGVLGYLALGQFSAPLMLVHVFVGLLLLAVWFFSVGAKSYQAWGGFLRDKKIHLHVVSLLYIGIFLGVLGFVNVLATRHNLRWDLTEQDVYTLSDRTDRMLVDLSGEVTLSLVDTSRGVERDQERELLELYERRGSPRVTLEVINPLRDLDRIDLLGIKSGERLLITYEGNGASRNVRLREIKEAAITNSLLRLLRPKRSKIYYLIGHGEPDLSDTGPFGMSELLNASKQEQIEIAELTLAGNSVPSDAQAVMVMSPRSELSVEEQEALFRYAESGGKLLLFTDPRRTQFIRPVAERFGIVVRDDVVVLPGEQAGGVKKLVAQIPVNEYLPHKITDGLRATDLSVFHVVASIDYDSSVSAPGVVHRSLFRSSTEAWGESDLGSLVKGGKQVELRPGQDDVVGPVSLAASYERSKLKDDDPSSVSRVLVFGDSDWLSNTNLHLYSNRAVLFRSLNWSIGEGREVLIPERTFRRSLALIPREVYVLLLTLSFVLPELFLLLGMFIWFRRREVYEI